MRDQNSYDHMLLLKDAGAVVADGAATVGGSARVLDLGLAGGGKMKAVIDTSAATFASHSYKVAMQGSVDLAFTSPVELSSTMITEVGRVELPFSNVKGDVAYRYLRAFNDVTGATPSINSTIFVAKG